MTGAAIRDLPLLGLMLGDCTGIGPEQCARVLPPTRDDQGTLREVLDEPGAREWAAASRSTEDHLVVPHEYADRRIAESPNDPPRPTRS